MLSCFAYFSLNVRRHNTVSGFLGLVSSYFLQQCYLFQCILEIKQNDEANNKYREKSWENPESC